MQRIKDHFILNSPPIFRHSLAPKWRVVECWNKSSVPQVLMEWLNDRGSLTQRLRDASSKSFRVQVLSCQWTQPSIPELMRLSLPLRQIAYIREVLLRVDETPWVFARTIIPRSSLTEKNRSLLVLGTKSLGELLFNGRENKRSRIEIGRLTSEHAMFHRAIQYTDEKPRELWARRSVFSLNQKPLLVQEVMLPAVTAFKNAITPQV